jgi:GAF domain-containing protein
VPATEKTNRSDVAPEADAKRLEAVRRWRILEVPPDGFEKIAALAAKIFDVPYAVVTVVDAERVWFRAHHGLEVDGIPMAPGLCHTVVRDGEPLVLPDARLHADSLTNPLVAGEFGLRFYAGAPLQTSDGYNLGSLAVLDQQPREVTPAEQEILSGLAAMVVREFELRLAARVQAAKDIENAEEQREKAGNFEAAMNTHGLIGQAMGIIMVQRRCDSRTAFDTLRKISQDRNIKLAELAHRLVADTDDRAAPAS